MRFVRGVEQGAFIGRVRGCDPGQVLVVPVDVGKATAMAMVVDVFGEVVAPALEFDLHERGVEQVLAMIARAEAAREARMVRVGVEAAGHYHRTLVARLVDAGCEVVELNPAMVAKAREEQGRRGLKTDLTDLAAMAELLARGAGHEPTLLDGAMAAQAAWAAHRRRKIKARVALGNQITSQLDLVFPGLDGCYADLLEARSGRVILAHCPDPDRVRRLGVEGLRRYVTKRGVAMTRPKAAQVVTAARGALQLPAGERKARSAVLSADVVLFEALNREIAAADAVLADVLADTPAGVLTSLPGVAVVRASLYGAGLGDPRRFRNANSAYRYAGLNPTSYDSAGKSRSGQHISRAGSAELRDAIIELGRGLADHHPDFAAYRTRKTSEGKKKSAVSVAVAHRAHRLAFAMVRHQTLFDPDQWEASVAAD